MLLLDLLGSPGLRSRLGRLDIDKDMAHGSGLRTPATTRNAILVGIHAGDLETVASFLVPVVPVQFADLVLAVEQIHPALAASTAASADFSDAVRRDRDLVDVLFREGEGLVRGGMEVSSRPC